MSSVIAGAVSGALLILCFPRSELALLAYRELTLAAFLTAKDNQTLPTFILSFVVRGEAPIAAALSLFLIAFMAPLVILYFLFGRRSFQVGAS